MPSVKFSLPDDDYLTPRDSMLFKSERDANGVYNPNCGICASPQLDFTASYCRDRWTPTSEKTYWADLEGTPFSPITCDYDSLVGLHPDYPSKINIHTPESIVVNGTEDGWAEDVSAPHGAFDSGFITDLQPEFPRIFLLFLGQSGSPCEEVRSGQVQLITTSTIGSDPVIPGDARYGYAVPSDALLFPRRYTKIEYTTYAVFNYTWFFRNGLYRVSFTCSHESTANVRGVSASVIGVAGVNRRVVFSSYTYPNWADNSFTVGGTWTYTIPAQADTHFQLPSPIVDVFPSPVVYRTLTVDTVFGGSSVDASSAFTGGVPDSTLRVIRKGG